MVQVRKVALIAVILILLSSLATFVAPQALASPGTNYYVDVETGDDGNDGSSWASSEAMFLL